MCFQQFCDAVDVSMLPTASEPLNSFIDEVNRCGGDFKWIRERSQELVELREKRKIDWKKCHTTILDQKFETSDDAGDSWYSDFRRSECDKNSTPMHCTGVIKESHLMNPEKRSVKELSSGTKTDLENMDKTDSRKQLVSIKEDSSLNDDSNEADRRIDRDHNDQESPTKNDLSHEANYKLSKFEQDPFDNRTQMMFKQNMANSVLVRNKRSLIKKPRDRPIAILAKSEPDSKGLNQNIAMQMEDTYDDDSAADIFIPEPKEIKMIDNVERIKKCKKCHHKSSEFVLNKTEILDNEDLLQDITTTSTEEPESTTKRTIKKNQIGITLEVKVNNVTRHKFEAVTQLRRRKKSAFLSTEQEKDTQTDRNKE